MLLVSCLLALAVGSGVLNSKFSSLAHWKKNQNAALYWGGNGNVEVLSQQATSTPGIRQDSVPVVKGKIYTIVAVGKSDAVSKLWVENSDGGEVVWNSDAMLKKTSSLVAAQFVATDNKVNVGVFFDMAPIGAKMTLERISLRPATKDEQKTLLKQAGLNANGKVFNPDFLAGEQAWSKNDKVRIVTERKAAVGQPYHSGKLIVTAEEADGTPGIRQNAITVQKNEVYTLTVKGHTVTSKLLAQPWVQDAVTGADLVWAASTPLQATTDGVVEVTFLAETTSINVGILMNQPIKGASFSVTSIHLAPSTDAAKLYIQQEIEAHRHSLVYNTGFKHHYGWWPNQKCKLEVKDRTLTVTSEMNSRSTPGVRQDGISVKKGKQYTLTIEGKSRARMVKPWIQDGATHKDIVWAKAPLLSNKPILIDFTPNTDRINVGVLFSGAKKGESFDLTHFSIRPKGWGCSHVQCRYNRNKVGGYSVKVFHHQLEEYGSHHHCKYSEVSKACSCECS
jgi:hypothetical protein